MPYFAKTTLFCHLLQFSDILFLIRFVQLLSSQYLIKICIPLYPNIPLNSYHLVPDIKQESHKRAPTGRTPVEQSQVRNRKPTNDDTLPLDQHRLTLISTWLNVLPLYTPTMDPTISGRMTMSLRWVFTTSGFSMGGASFLALRRRFRRDCCLRRRPRFSLLLWRAQYSCISCSLQRNGHQLLHANGVVNVQKCCR